MMKYEASRRQSKSFILERGAHLDPFKTLGPRQCYAHRNMSELSLSTYLDRSTRR
jgi:hypothetical protein